MKRSIKHIFTLYVSLILVFSFAGSLLHPGFAQAGTEAGIPALADTIFNIWYGDIQTFGQGGNSQQWINILGNVSDADGIYSLQYSLNGGSPVNLNGGPDDLRLAAAGDFNIDIHESDLDLGANSVVIRATDALSATTVHTVTVNYQNGPTLPLPHTVTWSNPIQNVAQVVDGRWEVTGSGLHTLDPGYYRSVAIGDMDWTEYEVTVPVTIHEVDWAGAGPVSGEPGIGLAMRWTGNTDDGFCSQPLCGLRPNGTIAFWEMPEDPAATELEFRMLGVDKPFAAPIPGATYYFKARVESTPGQGGRYSFKVWRSTVSEPSAWDLTYQDDASDLPSGAVWLFAHHVDATFGNVSVQPLSSGPYTLTVNTAGSGTGSVTRNPNQATYTFGTPVVLTAQPAAGSFFSGWSGDLTGLDNPKTVYMTGNRTVTANFTAGSPVRAVSDDYNTCSLNTGLWTFINPLGDATVAMTGTHAVISVSGNEAHTASSFDPEQFENRTARIMQPVSNQDFELEVEFDSGLTAAYQTQGIIIEQDANDLLRFEFFGKDATYVFAGVTEQGLGSDIGGTGTPIQDLGYTPLKLRVERQGDDWTFSYFDPTANDWQEYVNFTQPMNVTAVGVYAGNNKDESQSGAVIPAHTAKVDYFYNVTSPGTGDGDGNTVTVTINGTGTVQKIPAGPSYTCGQQVRLEAQPASGWGFSSWSGAVVGSTSPVTLTVSGDHSVTATFGRNNYQLNVIKSGSGSGTVSSAPAGINCGTTCTAMYAYETSVTLTAAQTPGSTFTGWSGACSGTSTTCVVSMDAAKSVTATFLKNYDLSVIKSGSGSGTVSSSPVGINCGSTCSATYVDGTFVTLTPAAAPGSAFAGWSGACSGLGACVVTMDAAKSVTATFLNGYLLTVSKSGTGSGTVSSAPAGITCGADCDEMFPYQASVTLTAAAAPGSSFTGWSGACSGTGVCVVTVDAAKSVMAHFARVVYLPYIVK